MIIYSEKFHTYSDKIPDSLFVRRADSDSDVFCTTKDGRNCIEIYDGGNAYLSDTFMPATFCESFFERQYGKMTFKIKVFADDRCREDFGFCIGLRGYDRNHAIQIEIKKHKIVQRIGNINHWLYDKEIILADDIVMNQWYDLQLDIDIRQHTFDFWLAGELKKENVMFWKNVDNISSFVIAAGRKDPCVERYLSFSDIEVESVEQAQPEPVYTHENRVRGKAPFKTLYGHDLTNAGIRWFKRPEDYFEALKSTVTELKGTGVDACLFQPYMTSVPLWPSKFYPPLEHITWWRKTFHTDVGQLLKIVEKGVDIVGEYVKWCRDSEISPFLSVRLNDIHHLFHFKNWKEFKPAPNLSEVIPRFYVENLEWMIDRNGEAPEAKGLNWRYEGSRKFKLEFIKELAEYDIDGIELDFMRNLAYYRPDELSLKEMEEITTGFVKEVRRILDEAAEKRPDKKKIWLCARIPAECDIMPLVGISIPALIKAGVEMLNVSSSFFTVNYEDLEKITVQADGASLYREGCHLCGVTGKGSYSGDASKRTTPLHYYTQANLAYKSGFDGYSTFNFAYYRGDGGKAWCNEPPFYIYDNIGDRDWVANVPQHYTVAWGGEYCAGSPHSKRIQMKRNIAQGQFVGFEMRMASPQGGWQEDGKIRIQCNDNLRYTSWRLWFNDTELEPTYDRSEYVSAYNGGFGIPDEYKAWIVPKELMRDGINYIGVKLEDGEDIEIIYIDLQVGGSGQQPCSVKKLFPGQ